MKILFLDEKNLSNTLKEIEEQKGLTIQECRVSFSEELECDTIIFVEDEKVRELPIEDKLRELSDFYGEEIVKYDVCEFGDFGEGFAFFLQ